MTSIFKVLKDSKRRVLQSVHAAADESAKTVDAEFDVHAAKFPEMIKDMNECGASLSSTLVNQKKMFADSCELAKSLARIYDSNLTMTDWTNVDCHLQQGAAAESYKAAWENIHTVIRSSSAMALSELGLEPLRSAVTRMEPEVNAACKERNTKVIDFDSYRRRVKDLQHTKEKQTAKSAGEGATPGDQKALEHTIAEIARFEGKLEVAQDNYKEDNYKVKDDIIKAKLAHDQIMDLLLVSTVVCQAEIFTRAANELNAIVATLPIDKVDQVRRRMEQYIAQGGVQFDGAPGGPSGKVDKGLALLSGKVVLSDLKKNKEEKNANLDKENEARLRAEAIAKEDMLMREQGRAENQPPAAPSAPPPLAPSAPPSEALPVAEPLKTDTGSSARPLSISVNSDKKFSVVATFDHDADADDELAFQVHDIIDVVDDTDEGWWFGRNTKTGKAGLFPVNYTRRL